MGSVFGEMSQGDVSVPLAAIRHVRGRQTSEGPVGTGPVRSVVGENSFYRETWGTRRGGGGRYVAKVVLTPGESTLMSNFREGI